MEELDRRKPVVSVIWHGVGVEVPEGGVVMLGFRGQGPGEIACFLTPEEARALIGELAAAVDYLEGRIGREEWEGPGEPDG